MSDDKHIDMVAEGGGERATTRGMLHRKRTGDLPVPFAEISALESIATGFRQQMLDLSDEKGKTVGSAQTGAGWGSDFITLQWGEKTAIVRGIDLLRAWVATFDPEAAKRLPDGLAR